MAALFLSCLFLKRDEVIFFCESFTILLEFGLFWTKGETTMETGGILEEAKKRSFPLVSYEDWYNKAKPSLINLDSSNNSIPWKALYTETDIGEWADEIRKNLPAYKGWKIAQLISGKTTEEIRENLLQSIDGGQDTLSFTLLNEWTWKDFQRLLKGIDLKDYPFFLHSEEKTVPLYLFLNRWANNEGINTKEISGFIGTDPLAEIALKGNTLEEAEDYYEYWCKGVLFAKNQLPNVKTIYIDGILYELAGGNSIEQLAYILLTGVEHLEHLKQNGLSEEEFFNKSVIGISVTSDFFTEIAKIRALRYLWGKLVEAYKLPPEKFPVSIYAETTITNKTTIALYNNLLRTSGEALAATIGQVDWLRIRPFDEVVDSGASPLAIRIARNTHHILREESSIHLVTDPAGGSYFLESLTKEMIKKAWALFLQGEEEGGMLESLKKGIVQQKLAASSNQKIEAYKNGNQVLLGIHIFPEENFEIGNLRKSEPSTLQKAKIVNIETLERSLEAVPTLFDFTIPVKKLDTSIPTISVDWWKLVVNREGWGEK